MCDSWCLETLGWETHDGHFRRKRRKEEFCMSSAWVEDKFKRRSISWSKTCLFFLLRDFSISCPSLKLLFQELESQTLLQLTKWLGNNLRRTLLSSCHWLRTFLKTHDDESLSKSILLEFPVAGSSLTLVSRYLIDNKQVVFVTGLFPLPVLVSCVTTTATTTTALVA